MKHGSRPVGVCGFRSLFPGVDLERVCLWDRWLSIVLGRTAAAIAALCGPEACRHVRNQVRGNVTSRARRRTGACERALARHFG